MALPRPVLHPDGMNTEPTISRTVRYVRFPLSADHTLRLQDGSSCPHCTGSHVQKWGRFSGRQRYRCGDCDRTFSTFTGTALHHLKHVDRWREYLWCVDGRLTVRRSAAVLGVDKNTALRWRHRLLEQWRQQPHPRLKGRLVIGEFCIPHSAKGSRALDRPARHHGEDWTFRFLQTDPVTVLVAWERPSAMIIETLQRPGAAGSSNPSAPPFEGGVGREAYGRFLAGRVRDVEQIVGFRGPFCPLAALARTMGVTYCRDRRSFFPTEVMCIRRELRTWLGPFRGVSTRRLDNYLEWFRRRGPSGTSGRNGPPAPPVTAGRRGTAPSWAVSLRAARRPTVPADRARWPCGVRGGAWPARPP